MSADAPPPSSSSSSPASPDLAPARVGERVLEHYELEALIGRGGVGVVYRARDVRTGATVAVKIMREDLLRVRTAAARFLREARIAQTLAHPAVPRGLEAGIDARTQAPVLVMDYLSGENFGALLAARGPLAVADAVRTGARVASALEAAHRAGVVHRDVKPENLMLLEGRGIPDGVAVLDFGLAFCLDEPRLSATHSFVGSVEYMSPEQARGEVVSSASDIYSLGATLVHLVTGKTLYEGNFVQQITAHARAPLPSLRARRPEIPRAVEHYLLSMLDKEPARRPSSAREVADTLAELAALCGGSGPATPPAGVPAPVAAKGTESESEGAAGAPGGARAASESEGRRARREALIEELHACSSELHHVARASAAAHQKMVQEIVEIAARKMDRALLANAIAERDGAGDAAAAGELRGKLAALGDAGADDKREAALEAALLRLQRGARAEQDEILETIRALQAELAGLSTGG